MWDEHTFDVQKIMLVALVRYGEGLTADCPETVLC